MQITKCDTFDCNIYCGLEEGYGTGIIHSFDEAVSLVRKFIETKKIGVTISQTNFLYPGGYEPGFVVGLINHPLYKKCEASIRIDAKDIAMELINKLNQQKVIIMFAAETIVLEK